MTEARLTLKRLAFTVGLATHYRRGCAATCRRATGKGGLRALIGVGTISRCAKLDSLGIGHVGTATAVAEGLPSTGGRAGDYIGISVAVVHT